MDPTQFQQSQSQTTEAPEAPSPLPPPKRRGRPSIAEMSAREGVTEAEFREKRGLKPSLGKTAPSNQTIDVEPGKRRKVPEDGIERDKALKGFRVYSRMCVKLVEKLNEFMDMEKLDEDEREAGIEAISALFYQESASLDARHLVALWLLTTEVPRVIVMLEKKSKEKKKTPMEKLEAQLAEEPKNGD